MKHLPFAPTPVDKLSYFSKKWGVNLWCKRDDLFPKAGGGSKARMLQYILADVNPGSCDVLITAGGPCSNFNRACTLMCAELGVPMHLVEYADNPEEFRTSLNYYLCCLADIKKTRCEKKDVPAKIQTVIGDYRQRGNKVKFCYGGGKSLEGFYSYYEAVKELKGQGIPLDYLFIACGTGTTLTGICAGMHRYYPQARVYAVSTARTWDAEEKVLRENLVVLNDYLKTSYDFSNLDFTDQFLCGGYARYNDDLMLTVKECLSKEGMITDPTYSGKAFYGMKSIIENSLLRYSGKNILFWNTGGIYNLLSTKYE